MPVRYFPSNIPTTTHRPFLLLLFFSPTNQKYFSRTLRRYRASFPVFSPAMDAAANPPASLSLSWKTRLALSAISGVTDLASRSNGTVNRRLLNLLKFKSPPNPTPVNGVKTSDVTVDPSRNLWFRVFVPTQHASDDHLPVIVFFHGGGFVFLSADATPYDVVCRRFARSVPAIVVSVNYRLAPEHRYPAPYEDGIDVLRFLDENSNCLPENAYLSRCFLAGDSAGGNLAHHVAKRAGESDFRKLKVIGLVAIQPYFGGEERTEAERRLKGTPIVSVKRTDWAWKAFLPPGENRDHPAINVSGPKAEDFSGKEFPATLVFVGGFDMLQDWQRKYYKWLKKCGKEAELIEYPNMFHAFYIFRGVPESTQLISQVKDFVHKRSRM